MDAPTGKKKVRKYPLDDLDKAVRCVNTGKASLRKASQEFNIPKSTIEDHIKERYPLKERGPARCITDIEEVALVEYITYMSDHGFPPRRCDVRIMIKEIVERTGRPSPFNDEKGPSDNWFRGFLSRHPQLSEKIPQTREAARSRMSNEVIIDGYFELYNDTVTKLQVIPAAIFNCDETGFTSKQKTREKAFGIRGRPSYQDQVISVDHVTAHMCVSAGGRVLPTLVIFQKSLPMRTSADECPSDWSFAVSESGYMNRTLFADWFEKIFIVHCGQTRPVLLLLDNHDSHISLKVIDMAIANRIDLLSFPSHTTHLLQPLDVAIFGQLKDKFSSLAISLMSAGQRMVNRTTFAKVWSTAINVCCSPAFVTNAFAKSGLVPFDPQAIDRSQLKPSFKGSRFRTGDGDKNSDSAQDPLVCPTCGHLERPHPIVAVRQLPVELRPVFQAAEAIQQSEIDRPKRKRATIDHGRLLTSEEWRAIIKKKEDDQCKAKEEAEKRKVAREEKKTLREQEEKQKKEKKGKPGKQTKKQQTTQKAPGPKPSNSENKENELASEDPTVSIDEPSVNVTGELHEPHQSMPIEDEQRPSTSSGVFADVQRYSYILTHSDDEGDDAPTKSTEDLELCGICLSGDPDCDCDNSVVSWLQCDVCSQWFHYVCLGVRDDMVIDCFTCSKCT